MSSPLNVVTGIASMLFAISAVNAQESTGHEHHEARTTAHGSESSASDNTLSEREHVPPEPPTHAMPDMSNRDMVNLMQMDDRGRFGRILVDQFEWRTGDRDDAGVWEAQGWYGGDYNKIWFRTEGERVRGVTEDARADLLWDRIFARWWSVQAGVRQDFGEGPARTWAALGIQGIAPYWFDIEATVYVGEQSRTAARFKTEYDLRFTQRLILQPEAEINLYSKSDPERGIGSGLSDIDAGLRLRYEFRRELAPYIGVTWTRRFGDTAEFAQARGQDASETKFVVGLRAWF